VIRLEPGPVALLELDNPPLNLVTAELTRELGAALDRVAGSPDVRAVVVAGAGERAFCAGSDVKEFEGLAGRVAEGKLLQEKLVYRKLAELPMPTVAAIEGDALGGGLELALCCDLRVASERARLGTPEVRLGVIPGSGGTQRLPAIVGPARAKEMILVGELLSAEAAERIGLVNRVVPAGQARAAAFELAQRIAERGPLAVREAKRLVDLSRDLDLDAGLAAELDASERLYRTEDMLEGARAFFEKRPPRFTGR
jgi:enoyl-CoA hydratase/carnithine racemase